MMNRETLRCAARRTILLFAVCGLGGSAAAQTPSPTAPTQTPPPSPAASPAAVSPEEADLAITANVTARELRFEVVPNPNVEFPGRPRRETVWEAERQNLPRPVQPGVTYRDIGIRLRILSVFADIDRIVAEALGEVPVSEDAPPSSTPPPQSPAAVTPTGAPPAAPASSTASQPSRETPR